MDTKILQDIGLTNAEVKLYLAVMETGSTTATELTKTTGLQSSVVYNTLPRLAKKGFISSTKRGRARYYQATDPETLIEYIEEKKQRLSSIIPELIAKQSRHRQEAEVYEGFRGWKKMLYSLVRDATRGDEYLFINFHVEDPGKYEREYEFYKRFEKHRQKKGINVKGIAHENSKRFFEDRDRSKIRFVKRPLPANITIFRDKIVLEPAWEKEQIAFLITSKELSDGFRKYWKDIWNEG